MRKNKLGWTDLEISNIGLGTWAIGGDSWQYGWGPQDDKDSVDTIEKAIASGINWIDTAPAYGLGHAEELVADAIKTAGTKPIIATKCGLTWNDERLIIETLKKESVRREVEESLKRLRVDVIDLYQIHWPSPVNEIEEAWGEIRKIIKEGKIRYAGVCNFTLKQLKRVHSIHPIASLQPPYNIFRRGIEEGILEYCKENNIAVIVYSPMERGLLTGKFTKERVANLPVTDHRRNASTFTEPELSINLNMVEKLKDIAKKNNKTVGQLAIAWTLRRSEVTAAIVGARNPGQVDQNLGGGDWDLSCEDIEAIELMTKERKAEFRCNG